MRPNGCVEQAFEWPGPRLNVLWRDTDTGIYVDALARGVAEVRMVKGG